jgi:hypothetical protein
MKQIGSDGVITAEELASWRARAQDELNNPTNTGGTTTNTGGTTTNNPFQGDAAGTKAYLEQLYLNELNRPADTKGLNYWMKQIGSDGVITAEELASWRAAAQDELNKPKTTGSTTTTTGGTTTNTGGTATGNQTNNAYSGTSRGVNSFLQDLYQSELGRAADTEGLNYWMKEIGSDGVITQDELKKWQAGAAKEKSARSQLNALYESVLGRAADTAGMEYWLKQAGADGVIDKDEEAAFRAAAQGELSAVKKAKGGLIKKDDGGEGLAPVQEFSKGGAVKKAAEALKAFLEPSAVKQRMYHGTAHDITAFRPGQSNAVFLSSSPEFTEEFAKFSMDRQILDMANNLDKDTAAKRNLLVPIIDKAIAEGKLGTPENTKGLVKTTREKHIEEALQKPLGRQLNIVGYGNELSDTLRARLSSGMNTMPVHVQVRNPFDYENPKHVNAVRKQLKKMANDEVPKENLLSGRWGTIEDDAVQEAIKDLGFDAFFVKEGGEKNLGVYDVTKIKSAIGNRGTYDTTTRLIAKAKGGLVHRADGSPEYGEIAIGGGVTPDTKKALSTNQSLNATEALKLLRRVYGEGASNLESTLRGSVAAIPGSTSGWGTISR